MKMTSFSVPGVRLNREMGHNGACTRQGADGAHHGAIARASTGTPLPGPDPCADGRAGRSPVRHGLAGR